MERCHRRGRGINNFEYITTLVSVLIGLAIADMATSLHKLLRNRRKVRWDWVAPMAALVILIELFGLWWNWRKFNGDSIADVAPYFAMLVLMFLAASATLPDDVPEDGLDLGAYFDETRAYFWAVYGIYVSIWIIGWTIDEIRSGTGFVGLLREFYFDYPWIIACFVLVFVRKRWLSGALLIVTLLQLLFGFDWWNRPLGDG